jgi:hypothetical protein
MNRPMTDNDAIAISQSFSRAIIVRRRISHFSAVP